MELSHDELNRLWNIYMNKVGLNKEWLKEVKLKFSVPNSSFIPYMLKDFKIKLKSDVEFREKWGGCLLL